MDSAQARAEIPHLTDKPTCLRTSAALGYDDSLVVVFLQQLTEK
jgi:hypothetical protein